MVQGRSEPYNILYNHRVLCKPTKEKFENTVSKLSPKQEVNRTSDLETYSQHQSCSDSNKHRESNDTNNSELVETKNL